MKKEKYLWATAALLTSIALLAGCAKEKLVEEPATPEAGKVWTATVDAEKAVNPVSKALTHDGEYLSSWWSGSDYLEVYNGDTHVGTLHTAGGSKTCSFSGPLQGWFETGQTLTLKFLLGNVSDPSRQYADQKGTLENLARRFDYAQATVQVTSVNRAESRISLSAAVFQNCQSITLFNFLYENSGNNKIRKLTITSRGLDHPVTVIPETPGKEFYIAIPAKEGATEKLAYDFMAEMQDGKLFSTTMKAGLENGKFYKADKYLYAYDPVREPFTIEALEAGTLEISNPNGWVFYYGINTGNIQSSIASGADIRIPLEAGDRIILGGEKHSGPRAHGKMDVIINQGNGQQTITHPHTTIKFTNSHYVHGNVMSLIHYERYWDLEHPYTKTAEKYALYGLFWENVQMRNHPVKEISLPATTVSSSAYAHLFQKCINLTRAPELPAEELTSGNYHYTHMFSGCFSLKKAPSILPAANVPEHAYEYMFYACSSMEATPVLPAENPGNESYFGMFKSCYSLKQITCYAKSNIDRIWYYVHRDGSLHVTPVGPTSEFYTGRRWVGATGDWVEGVPPGGMFIGDEDTSWPVGNNGVPYGWTGNSHPLTIEAVENGTITITNPLNRSIRYGKLPTLASATEASSSTITIDVAAGDKVRFWGDNASYGDYVADKYLNIRSNALHYAYGDIRSLINSTDYLSVNTLEKDAFLYLFRGDTGLRNHPSVDISLAASNLGEGCYRGLFYGCTGIYRTPELPAATLGAGCYDSMFSGCSSLTTARDLLATRMAEGCYAAMFSGCTSLGKAPDMSTAILADECYANMFDGCTALVEAPVLYANDLKPGCYNYMFRDCSRLKEIRCAAFNPSLSDDNADPPTVGSVDGWLDGVAAGGTFTCRSGVSWPAGSIPADWRVNSSL